MVEAAVGTATSSNVVNPFAITLYFYYLYHRTKLTAADLTKIAKKYATKPGSLLQDLSKKYSDFDVPPFVYISDLVRIIGTYSVPNVYISLLGYDFSTNRYDALTDIYSDSFSGEHVLRVGYLLAGSVHAIQPLDNLSKVKHLLPGAEPSQPKSHTHVQGLRTVRGAYENVRSVLQPNKHLFHAIADLATRQPKESIQMGQSVDADTRSPLSMIHQLMLSKTRVRIILRRTSSIRGSLDAYIRAFDRHFNMLLFDVDEEFITNQQRNKEMKLGKFHPKAKITKRHHPQLLLRGDNVVLMFQMSSALQQPH